MDVKEGKQPHHKVPATVCQSANTAADQTSAAKDVTKLFEKMFIYELPSERERNLFGEASDLDCHADGWLDEELQQLKRKLNGVKSMLSGIDIEKWHQHTSTTNPGRSVLQHLRQHIQPELCTQAWAKLHELLYRFPLIDDNQQGSLNTIHLCEAPGAFIASLNHYLKNTGIKVVTGAEIMYDS